MHASARVLDATPERDLLPPISNQQSSNRLNPQYGVQCPLLILPGQLHFNDPHHLHHNSTETSPSPQPSEFSTLSALAFGGDVHLYIATEPPVLAALRLPPSPPLNPNAPPAAALLAPAILTDCYRHTTSTRLRTVTNTTTPESPGFPYTLICFSQTDIIRYRDLVPFALSSYAHAHPVPNIPNTNHPSIASVERTTSPSGAYKGS